VTIHVYEKKGCDRVAKGKHRFFEVALLRLMNVRLEDHAKLEADVKLKFLCAKKVIC
jgi:hypothetical protein